MSKIKLWIKATRPYSFPATLAPVALGICLAYASHDEIKLTIGLLTAVCALLMQIGANLCNDYYDWKNGVDKEGREGFERISGGRIISPQSVQLSYIFCLTAALALGIYLTAVGGYPILFVGLLSIALAYLYTGGPWPLAYHALGEIVVIIFFGPIAVGGAYFLQTGTIDSNVLVVSLAPGLISAAIMAINNLRDRESDKAANKHTLANIFSEKTARLIPIIFISIATLIPFFIAHTYNSKFALASTALAYLFFMTWKRICFAPIGKELNSALKQTGLFLTVYVFIICVAFLNKL